MEELSFEAKKRVQSFKAKKEYIGKGMQKGKGKPDQSCQ